MARLSLSARVTAEGDTAAIFPLAMSADGKAIGTIEIEGAIIQTPEGGKVIDYRNKEELSDGVVYEAGQTIGTGDVVVDSPYDEAVAKSAVIAPPEEAKPEPDTKPGKKDDGGVKQVVATTQAPSSVKASVASAKGTPATGDASAAGVTASGLAGLMALLGSKVMRRRQD